MSSPLRPYGLQHARLPCPSPTSKVCSDSCPSNQWCHPAISSSVVPFSSCLQTFPASGSFPMMIFASRPKYWNFSFSISLSNEYSGLIIFRISSLISLPFKELSRVFFSTTIWKHQFFGAQPSLWSNSHIHTWLLKKPIALTMWTFVGKLMSLFF